MTHWILSFILFNFLLRVSKKCIEGFFFTVYAENRIIHCTFACCDRTLMCASPKWILQQIRTNPNCESKVHPFVSFGFLYHHGNSATSLNQSKNMIIFFSISFNFLFYKTNKKNILQTFCQVPFFPFLLPWGGYTFAVATQPWSRQPIFLTKLGPRKWIPSMDTIKKQFSAKTCRP